MKKNILFICPDFFGYNKMIESELRMQYKGVFMMPEYPMISSKQYVLLSSISKRIIDYLWDRYEKQIISIIKDNSISTILIIRGAYLRESFLIKLSSLDLNIIHYQWDSIKNNKNALIISKYSKSNYTFDRLDSEKYDFTYLPLFYCWPEKEKESKKVNKLDILFVASWSRERSQELRKIRNICECNGLTLYPHIYISFFSYIKRLFVIKDVPFRDIKFFVLSRTKYFSLLKVCKAVFDIPSNTQVGCSMRTIEALSLQKKIITNNKSIIKESFYCSNNFIIWPEENYRIKEVLNTPFASESDANVLSLNQWLRKMGII